MFRPVFASHKRTVVSGPPLAIVFPSGEKLTLSTPSVCPVSVFMFRPVFTSHKRTVLSQLPLAIVFPSGEKLTLLTPPLCPVSIAISATLTPSVCPVSVLMFFAAFTSHKRMVLSQLPLAIVFPSGEKLTRLTLSVCPISSLTGTGLKVWAS